MRKKLSKKQKEQCHSLLDELFELYDETLPEKGKLSEKNKHHKAELAIQKAGLLTGILTQWAENQIHGIGYKLQMSSDGIVNDNECNKHENETMFYVSSPEDLPEDIFYGDKGLTSLRVSIATILKNSIGVLGPAWAWRENLYKALYAVNEGQVDWILEPANTNQKGNAYDLQNIKWAVTKHVYFLLGEGWKKTAARQKLAECCDVSFETVKKWEKESISGRNIDEDALSDLSAGSFTLKTMLENGSKPERLMNDFIATNQETDECDIKNMTYTVVNVLRTKEEYPLENLKEMLECAGLRSTGTKP